MTDKAPAKKKAPEAPVEERPRRSALALELRHVLSQGDLGGQVKAAQQALIGHGFTNFRDDGRYGTLMGKEVRRFQASRGLRVTGEINAATWEALFSKAGS